MILNNQLGCGVVLYIKIKSVNWEMGQDVSVLYVQAKNMNITSINISIYE